MPSCLHLLNSYLPRTETFIWRALSLSREFRPLILAERLENRDLFPLPHAAFLQSVPARSRLAAALARLRGRFGQYDYRACLGEVRALKPDAVHVHNGYRACVSFDFTRTLALPTAVNFYGADLTQSEYLRRARPDYARLFRSAAAFLVEGPAMQRKLAALGCPEARIRLQRIALDPGEYVFRPRSWDGKRPIRFLFVGRLVEKKGLEFGLRALAACKEDFPWELTVIGDGPLRPRLEAVARELGFESGARPGSSNGSGRRPSFETNTSARPSGGTNAHPSLANDPIGHVAFRGFMDLENIRDEMDKSDILLQPSCTSSDGDGEGGAPTVLLEAQACGMPIVATTHADIPYVTTPESARLAPEGDVHALAEQLKKLAGDAERWAEMGRAGRRHVEERHDARRESPALENIYRDIIG